MHQALFVSEILSNIFAHVYPFFQLSLYHTDSRLSRYYTESLESPYHTESLHHDHTESLPVSRTLAALAITCKLFHEPAMDLLWADIRGLLPLLGCVTRLNPIVYRNYKTQYLWSSEDIEPLSEHEARQFLRHATRVRSFHEENSRHFHLLENLSFETCAFPSLVSLSFTVDHPQAYAKFLRLFLSPTLRQCYLSVRHPDFKYFATHFTALEHLHIQLRPFSHSIADDLSLLYNSIRSCKQLATLSCPPLDWATWRHISNLPTLLTVDISEPRRVPRWPSGRDTHNFAPFHNLTGLSFDVDTAAYTIAVIQHSELPSLRDFVIHVQVLPWPEAEQLCCALSQCKADQKLEHINIICNGELDEEPSSSSMTVITQFFCFTQLRTLQLEFPHCCFNLDNNLLLEAMASWPHICSLELSDMETVPTVTFRGLFTALSRCPNLLRLNMSMDVAGIDIDPTAESFQHTTLESLKLTRSRVADAEAVARILFSMLPRVDKVTDRWDPWNTEISFQKHWDEVNRHLDLLNGREPQRSQSPESEQDTDYCC